MKSIQIWFVTALVSAGCAGQSGPSTEAQKDSQQGLTSTNVEISSANRQDVSGPLRDLPSAPRGLDEKADRPLKLLGPHKEGLPDGALQSAPGPTVATAAGLSFPGVGNGDYGFAPNAAPPDTNGAVGATQFVQWVNESFAVFDKSTGAIAPGFPKTGNTIWAGFGGNCEARNDGDPIVQYDKAAGRWILTQFSVPSGGPFEQCVAVSTTSDATGTYNRYSFNYGNTQFVDYPKLGVWPDAYYITYNIFNNGTTFAGAKLCAFDRAAMLTGAAATQRCFQLSNSFGGVLPSDLDGTTQPPAGSPNFLLNFSASTLNEWKFHSGFADGTAATLTGPFAIPVAAFTEACGGGTCVPQSGTNNTLDSLADRLMYRLAYRNLGGVESLVVNHSVKAGGTKRAEIDGVRWYELRAPNGASGATLFQQGTFAPDSTSRWMGSIAMDKVGNIAVGYSASSATLFPSIRFTGLAPGDPLGTLGAETIVLTGGGSQTGNLHRWGDYSAMTVDPIDDCTFWYTTEYEKTSGSFNWSTQITSFKFPSCL